VVGYLTVPLLSQLSSRRRVAALVLAAAGIVAGLSVLLYATVGQGPAPGAARLPGASAAPDGSGAADPASSGPSPSASVSPSRSASPAPSASAINAPPPPVALPPPPGWKLMWAPEAKRDGLGAFEGVEDDRANPHPTVKHIYVQGNDYRFDMPKDERDTATDRQRNEVKGMHTGGQDLALGLGETWRLDWSIYLPDSLQGTFGFTHIMQLKMPGNDTKPILTMDLTRNKNTQAQLIQVKVFDAGIVIASTDLAPLHNKWLSSSLTFTIGDAPAGAVSWTLSAGGAPVTGGTKTGVDTWLQERVRPKWGIYRSVEGFKDPYPLANCSMLISNMRAYRK
jgi:hypothetical protein